MSTIAEELVRLQQAKSDFKSLVSDIAVASDDLYLFAKDEETWAVDGIATALDITEEEANELLAMSGTLDSYPTAFRKLFLAASKYTRLMWVEHAIEEMQYILQDLEVI